MQYRSSFIFFLLVFLTFLSHNAVAGEFNIGAAKTDITGPAAELGMMGYAELSQKTTGIHTRLYARAFVVEDTIAHNYVAYVNADLAFIAQAVKIAVVKQLEQKFSGIYSHDNVMIAATHTHSGPGGYSSFALYNMTVLGFDQQNFNTIVNGIVDAIQRAHQQRQPGSISFAEGRLENATINRSLSAYYANPTARNYNDTTNKIMTVLKFTGDNGKEIGMINWFSMHSTCLSKHNHLISSDSKGYPALKFEKIKPGFIAAFSNSDEGDVSPNIYDQNWNRKYNEFDGLRLMGEMQYSKALELYQQSGTRLRPTLEYRHTWIKMPGYVVGQQYTGDSWQSLCKAAMGYSFAAGAEDGRSDVAGMREGLRQGDVRPTVSPLYWLYNLGRYVFFGLTSSDERCHAPKPILFDTGRQSPSWTPEVLPFQIIRIGRLVIAGVPAELTTMAGRELRNTITAQLSSAGVDRVVIAGLANSYSDYVATKPEYDTQQYEGASTLYGPYTHSAYLQIFSELADGLRRGGRQIASITPSPDQHPQISLQTGVVFDDKRLWEKFGQVMRQPNRSYTRGQTVVASFRTGHPKNNLKINSTYFEIQKRSGTSWFTIARDSDNQGVYQWRRDTSADCKACSFADIYWNTSQWNETGDYRIIHYGAVKNGWNGAISNFSGVTTTFTLH